MSRFVLRQIARNQSAKDILVDRTVTIQAESGATYQILDARSMKPATGVVLKRKGDALVVEADGEVAVEVERFYGSQAGAVFEASGGGGQVQVVTEATAVPELSPGAAQGGGAAAAANGAGGELLVGALALGGLGLLSSSGGSAAAPVDNTVVAKVVAGPVVKGNDLIAMIYAADDKTLLGQGAINEDGTVTIKVGSYTGVVIVKVKNDQNPANDGADYMDEATGVAKDLGDAVLSSMGEIVTLNGVITLNASRA
jgi:formylmethanofuran dehydrogenase subunit D